MGPEGWGRAMPPGARARGRAALLMEAIVANDTAGVNRVTHRHPPRVNQILTHIFTGS
jgi:hypothetical protein